MITDGKDRKRVGRFVVTDFLTGECTMGPRFQHYGSLLPFRGERTAVSRKAIADRAIEYEL